MRQYEMVELAFSGNAPEGSQVEVAMTAVFTKDGVSTCVKGFYAGNGTYKVRFLAMEAGTYTYEVNGEVQNRGTIEIEPALNGKHGPVRAEGTHLQFADGTYFYSFGTTVYALAHQDAALTEETFRTLEEAPFNKIRMCVFPKHYRYNINDPEYFPFETFSGQEYHGVEIRENAETGELCVMEDISDIWDVHHPCFAFWDAFEEKVKRLDQLGIQVDLILFHPYDRWGFSRLSQEDNMVYLDYVLRRLSAFPNIWWSMANEYDLCDTKSAEDWKEFENFIAANDAFHHMLSNHNCLPLYDFSGKGITHCSIQKRMMNLSLELQSRYHKPVCYDECAYEGNLKEAWGSISGKEMVNRFWKASVTGAFCTHGEVFLDPDMKQINEAVLWWAKGGKLYGESPERIAFLREVIEGIGAPLDPVGTGIRQLLRQSKEMKSLPPELAIFVRIAESMDPVELIRQVDIEYEYVGETADRSAILYYYGTDCHARVDVQLPEDRTYTVEVIDAWNMTREKVAEHVSGKQEVKLPGREYMAVLAIEE